MSGQRRLKEPSESYFPLRGGLDLNTPPYQIEPGKMLDCIGYEISPSGGYKPIDGFERVDGQGVPSEAVFQYLVFDEPAAAFPVGTVIVGTTSAATATSLADGLVLFPGADSLELVGRGIFRLTAGAFQTGETVEVAGVVTATIEEVFEPNSEFNSIHELHYHWLAVEHLRSLVVKVPGSGPIRGVWRYKGTIYAFRDNVGGTACLMHKENSVIGWTPVTTPVLVPGGAYRFENTNFGGSSSTIMMYGCDGKNKAFEFDGTTFTQITTGMTADTPYLVFEHGKHLFLGFPGGSLQHSPPTQPRGVWSVVLNAGELGLGEELQDAMSLPGGVLGIWCKDSIAILHGTGVDTWNLLSHTKKTGGMKGTVQDCGKILFLNSTGIADLGATNAFGNFKSGTISAPIQPLLNKLKKSNPIASVAIPGKNQYRIFFSNNVCVTTTLGGRSGPEFTLSEYPLPIRCISAPVRADDEIGNVYFGSDDGYVYKMDSGVSLDHTPMKAYFRLPFAHQGSPNHKKRYRKVTVELDANESRDVRLRFYQDFSLTQADVPVNPITDVSTSSGFGAGVWNISNWNEFSWDSGFSLGGGGSVEGRINGVATEIGLVMYFDADNTVTPLNILNGVFIHFNLLGRKK